MRKDLGTLLLLLYEYEKSPGKIKGICFAELKQMIKIVGERPTSTDFLFPGRVDKLDAISISGSRGTL